MMSKHDTTRGREGEGQESALDIISIVNLAYGGIHPRVLIKEGVFLFWTRRLGRHWRIIINNSIRRYQKLRLRMGIYEEVWVAGLTLSIALPASS
jgi:hypothetical protein